MQAQTEWAAAITLPLQCRVANKRLAWRSACGAQVRNVCGSERGRTEAAHLLQMLHGALLREALSAGGLARPQSSVQAAAGSPEVRAIWFGCMLWAMWWNVIFFVFGALTAMHVDWVPHSQDATCTAEEGNLMTMSSQLWLIGQHC